MIDWISVDERLPDDTREILIHADYRCHVGHIANTVNGGFLKDGCVKLEDVTHWAEINEPESKE